MTAPILSEGLLSREAVKMMTAMKHPSSSSSTHNIATLELSPLDMLYDFYNAVLLVYDIAGQAHMSSLQPPLAAAAQEPVGRLQQAIQEMIAHFPCAAGLVVYNESIDRLEIKYPTYNHTLSPNNGSQIMPLLSYNDTSPNNGSHPEIFAYGLPFHVAHANVSLADLGDVSNPQPALDLLYPAAPPQVTDSKGHPLPRFVMAFQVTTFKCGGFSIGHTCSHVYADGSTAAAFLQNLSSIARGAGLANSLHSVSSRKAIIRAREPPSPTMPHKQIQARKRTEQPESKRLHFGTATRFRFTMDALEDLRASVSIPGQSEGCSRNVALVALLWTAFARVKLEVQGLPGSHELDLAVPMNMRTRGLCEGYMGNGLCRLSVPATLQELCGKPLGCVVDKIKRTLEGLDVWESLQSMVDHIELHLRDGRTPYIVGLAMTSLVALPFYDTDCGWGAPMYVGRPSQQLSISCIIMDHPMARAWNVLVVFASFEEHACFQETIAKYIS